ncbi:4'-phosphopantetheinyl transferase superfamily protein [Solibacillus sp. MA9]|uniref:4'-phosphopantetheinyl transferase superfamily protein n=1 Tax=Solibacillus palustris TaxID=2908203 RepID=A0ABS9UDU3_9BACL|nr:4'-phosphopantetheinyl transferase superfamily protein [Solibacillus sp. MA9]MCH7322503.1 4'-phosphopantetheinyl transferase superfamily protein [Solibacillus sp. MA9]
MLDSKSIIYALKIDFNIEQTQYNQLLTKLTCERQRKVKQFRKREDAIRCIFADILARYVVHKFNGCTVDEVQKKVGVNGKPILTFPRNVHFNVSHAGIWLVCIVDEKPVGIDIERIQEIDIDIAQSFFTKEEYAYIIYPMTIDEQQKRFFQIWTMKECYVKATGEGLSKNLLSFSVHFNNQYSPTIIDNSIKQQLDWQFEQYMIDESYILSVASHKKSKKIKFLESGIFLN